MKRAIVIIFILIICGLLLISCGEKKQNGENVAEYRKITAAEAYAMMTENEVVVVDVRTKSEYDEGHIKNAILIPNETIGDNMPSELPDKDAVILLYCRSGRRSREAAYKLLSLGYKNVYDFGGINDWEYGTVK